MNRLRLAISSLLLLLAGAGWSQPIEVALFEGGEGREFFQQAAQEYMELVAGSRIVLEADPRIADRVRLRILEGDFPAVTNASVNIWALIEKGEIQPLDSWLDGPAWDGEGSWGDSFLPGSLDPYTFEGKTYGIPLQYVVWSVYYNKAVFRQRGWSPPETWPQLLELCAEIKQSGLAPVAFQGQYPFYAMPLLRHTYFHLAGEEAYNALLRAEPGAFDNPEMVEALGLIQTLAKNYFQPGAMGMSHTAAQLEFFQGRAAMLFCGSWLFSEMQDNIPSDFELGAFPLPLPDSTRAHPGTSFVGSGGYLFVFSSSANPAGGADFLRYLSSARVMGRFASQRGLAVATARANQKLNPTVAEVAAQLSQIEHTFGEGSGPGLQGLGQVWTDALGPLLQGRGEPAQLAAQMETEAQLVRARHLHPDRVAVRHQGKALLLALFLLGGTALGVAGGGSSKSQGASAPGGGFLARFLGPSLLIYSLFFMLPSALALAASLVRWDGLGPPDFVGTLHFRRLLLESDGFWIALTNNLILMLIIPALVLPLSLFLANCLHQEVWGSRVFRVAFFFPNLIGVAGILLWKLLYNPQGPVNQLLSPLDQIFGSLGLAAPGEIAFLSSEWLYWGLVPMGVWGACGFHMVLFLAAMQSVSPHLYEAAELNGANAWEKFRYITLPAIWETLLASVIFMIIAGMKAFEVIWLLTDQSPATDTHVIGTLLVQSMFTEQRIGQAAAVACLLFLIVLVGSLLAARFNRGEVE